MALPLLRPRYPEVPSEHVHDWFGPHGSPNHHNRFPVAPELASTFLDVIENLVTNPSLEDSTTTGWSVINTAPTTLASQTGWADSGTRSLRYTVTAAATTCGVIWGRANALAEKYYFGGIKANVLDPGLDVTARLNFLDNAGTSLSLVAGAASSGTGIKDLIVIAKSPIGTTKVDLNIRLRINSGDTFDGYFDSAIIAQIGYPVSFFDGNSAESFWTGTTNASSSKKIVTDYNMPPTVDWSVNHLGGDFSDYISITGPCVDVVRAHAAH